MAECCGCPLADAWRMRGLDFLALRRDAFVHAMRRAPAGREWLAQAWRPGQAEPDADGLREALGGGRGRV